MRRPEFFAPGVPVATSSATGVAAQRPEGVRCTRPGFYYRGHWKTLRRGGVANLVESTTFQDRAATIALGDTCLKIPYEPVHLELKRVSIAAGVSS